MKTLVLAPLYRTPFGTKYELTYALANEDFLEFMKERGYDLTDLLEYLDLEDRAKELGLPMVSYNVEELEKTAKALGCKIISEEELHKFKKIFKANGG